MAKRVYTGTKSSISSTRQRYCLIREQENSRLKKLVTDLSLDNAILKEASRGSS